MKLLVYLRDGRTVFLISTRTELRQLLAAEPHHEEKGVLVAKGTWNPVTGEYLWQQGLSIRYIAKGSIAWIEQGQYSDVKALQSSE